MSNEEYKAKIIDLVNSIEQNKLLCYLYVFICRKISLHK